MYFKFQGGSVLYLYIEICKSTTTMPIYFCRYCWEWEVLDLKICGFVISWCYLKGSTVRRGCVRSWPDQAPFVAVVAAPYASQSVDGDAMGFASVQRFCFQYWDWWWDCLSLSVLDLAELDLNIIDLHQQIRPEPKSNKFSILLLSMALHYSSLPHWQLVALASFFWTRTTVSKTSIREISLVGQLSRAQNPQKSLLLIPETTSVPTAFKWWWW